MNNVQLLHRVRQQVRPYRLSLAAVFAISLLAAPIALLLPLPLKIVVDSVIGDHPLPALLSAVVPAGLAASAGALLGFAVALLLAVTLFNSLQTLANNVLREYVGERMVLDFRHRLFEHVQRLSLAFHDAQGVSHSAYRIQWDAAALRGIILEGAIPLVTSFFTVLGMVVVTALISAKLAAIALVVCPVLVGLTYFYSRRLRERWREAHSLQSSAFGIVQETLGALRVVNAFGQEERENSRFVHRSLEGLGARLRTAWMENALSLVIGLTIALGTGAVLFVGVTDIRNGALTLGELLLIMGYLSQLYAPLRAIGKQVARQQKSLASLERTFQLLDQTPAVAEPAHGRPLVRADGSISFQDVWFGYDEEHPVLQGISFEAPAGRRIGIAGATGAGKSTLLSLLVRFYDPTRGRILLDGIDLRDYRLRDLRRQFAVVLQEPVLFSTSIAENIAYARPEASEAEITAAARAANAHDFILGLPDGYDTVVGERGMRLSGGERQRVSLARAFLKDAPLLILDEPTSSVDLETEAVIMQAMDRLMQGRTTFMIAHRLSTLESCDRLLMLEGGRLTSTSESIASAIDKLQPTRRTHSPFHPAPAEFTREPLS